MKTETDDIAGIYLAQEAGEPHDGSADTEGLARCDAVMALTPKLANHPDVAWAFDEARQLARSKPSARAGRGIRFGLPTLNWSIAGVAACSALTLMLFVTGEPRVPANPVPATSNNLSTLENQIADFEPVVLIADGVPVDGRSIAILPFTDSSRDNTIGATAGQVTTAMLYENVVRQATATGFYVAGPEAAAVFANAQYTPAEIASYLNVRGVVTASVDTDGDSVSLDLHVTDASGSNPDMARRFDVSQMDMSELEQEITASLLSAFKVQQLPVPVPAP